MCSRGSGVWYLSDTVEPHWVGQWGQRSVKVSHDVCIEKVLTKIGVYACVCVCVSVYWGRNQRWTFIIRRASGWQRDCRFSSLSCLLYTYCMFFSHDRQTGRNQNARLDTWPQTAPLPLCSDKWPSSKSWSLWTIEKKEEQDRLEMIMESHIFALGTRSVQH